MKKSLIAIAVLGFSALSIDAYAACGSKAMSMGMNGMKMDGKQMDHAQMSMSDGEVKGINTAGKQITLKHGPIKSKSVE